MMNSQNRTSLLPSSTAGPAPPTGVIYPTVSPETVVIPIVSSIVVFPAAALTVICCLRYRARRARRSAKRPRLGDKADRSIPIIRIDGSRRPDLGLKGKWKRRGDEARHMHELHFSSATVFQAVLGMDLDIDERSEWENEVMGYTSIGAASPTSIASGQEFPTSGRPHIIDMEMSPRICRPARTRAAAPASSKGHRAKLRVDFWRRQDPRPPLRNGGLCGPPEPHRRPPDDDLRQEPRPETAGRQGDSLHPEPHRRSSENDVRSAPCVRPLEVDRSDDPHRRPEGGPCPEPPRQPAEVSSPRLSVTTLPLELGTPSPRRGACEDARNDLQEATGDQLRYIDDSSEAS